MTGTTGITFLRRHEVQDEHAGTAQATVYEAGRSYRVGADTARHFLSRGIAVATADVPPAKAKSKARRAT